MTVHLFLSPHLDDAVLSCGATIHRLTEGGASVLILTVAAGQPPNPLPDSPLVRELHSRWKIGDNAPLGRIEEDRKAAASLGAQVYYMDIADCIYRTVMDGSGGHVALYPDGESLFGDVHICDDAQLSLLSTPLPLNDAHIILYAPLGIGHHIDHQIVRDWAMVLAGPRSGPELKFYEEYPGSRDKMAVEQALHHFKTHVRSLELQPETVTLTEANVAAKVQAIACYASQISSFWPNLQVMEQEVRQFMSSTGLSVERYWHKAGQRAGAEN